MSRFRRKKPENFNISICQKSFQKCENVMLVYPTRQISNKQSFKVKIKVNYTLKIVQEGQLLEESFYYQY